MCASVHTLECNLPPPYPEKADRSDATIIRVRLPDLLVFQLWSRAMHILQTDICMCRKAETPFSFVLLLKAQNKKKIAQVSPFQEMSNIKVKHFLQLPDRFMKLLSLRNFSCARGWN